MCDVHVRRDKAFDWARISLGTRQIGMPFALAWHSPWSDFRRSMLSFS
jgi:hypothetical protein